MAGHAAHLVVVAHAPACGIVETCWRNVLTAECRAKALQFPEPTDPAFIPFAIFLQDISLPDGEAGSDGPADGHGDCVCPIRNGVDALISLALDAIAVLTLNRLKLRMFDENFAFFNGLERVPHGGGGLRGSLPMAAAAFGRAPLVRLADGRRTDEEPKA